MEFTISNVRKFCKKNPGAVPAWEQMFKDMNIMKYTKEEFLDEVEWQKSENKVKPEDLAKLLKAFPGTFSWEKK